MCWQYNKFLFITWPIHCPGYLSLSSSHTVTFTIVLDQLEASLMPPRMTQSGNALQRDGAGWWSPMKWKTTSPLFPAGCKWLEFFQLNWKTAD